MAKQKLTITFVYSDFESVGVEYLMALCHKEGYRTKLVFYRAENAYLAKTNLKPDFKKIAGRVGKTRPDLAAFSCVTDNYQAQLGVARALKKLRPGLATIFGGVHPTSVPKLVLKEPAVGAIAIGEAEASFIEFLKNCRKAKNRLVFPQKKIKGIVFKKRNKLIGDFKEGELIDLNDLPLPFKKPFYSCLKETRFRYSIITSRGCPYHCSYCVQSMFHRLRGKSLFRQRSVEHVIDELLWAKKKFKFKIVYFMDDLFTVNKKWLFEFLERYRKEIVLPFGCATHPQCLDEERSRLLGEAGCIFASFGVQSLSPSLSRKVLRRPLDKKKIIKAIYLLKKAGIMVQIDHLFGIPGDTLRKQEKAILFYNQHRPHLVSVFWLTYYPGTPIVQIALEKGVLSEKDKKMIEAGRKITRGSLHDGGSLKDPRPFLAAQFLLNYYYFLPKHLVRFLVESKLYRIFKIRNFYLSTALPRTLLSLLDKRYFWGRSLIISYLDKKDR